MRSRAGWVERDTLGGGCPRSIAPQQRGLSYSVQYPSAARRHQSAPPTAPRTAARLAFAARAPQQKHWPPRRRGQLIDHLTGCTADRKDRNQRSPSKKSPVGPQWDCRGRRRRRQREATSPSHSRITVGTHRHSSFYSETLSVETVHRPSAPSGVLTPSRPAHTHAQQITL